MKKRILQIVSSLMALLVLFVSIGWNVNFHYCTEDHHLLSSFGDASRLCEHCQNHPHRHMNATQFEEHLNVVHFDEKCCCDDFDSKIQFTDNYTFSPEKHIAVFLQPALLPHFDSMELLQEIKQVFHFFSPQKIPFFLSGRQMTIFFSNLKLNPLIF